MKRTARLLGSIAGVLAFAACGSDDPSTFAPDGGAFTLAPDGAAPAPFADASLAPPDAGTDAGTCAESLDEATRTPIVLFLSVDASGSMAEPIAPPSSGTGITKWSAVTSALTAFFGASSSAGMTASLSLFPRNEAGVPVACATKADCGPSGGACELHFCKNGGYPPTFCDTDGDCPGSLAGSCVLSGTCSDDARYQCNVPAGSCGFGEYACGGFGATCTDALGAAKVDDDGYAVGTCLAETSAACEGATMSCAEADYATPDVAAATLPAATASFDAAIGARKPYGGTPTYAALESQADAAVAYKAAHPGDYVAVVYATDALPDGCAGAAPEDDATIAGIAATATKGGVFTYVVGVFATSEQATAGPRLADIATAGGTGTPYLVATDADAGTNFLAALEDIRARSVSCAFPLPPAEAGTVDETRVNVDYVSSSGTTVLAYVGTVDRCDATKGGWIYGDGDAGDDAGPGGIVLCPAACDALKADLTAKIDVAEGCRTVTAQPPAPPK